MRVLVKIDCAGTTNEVVAAVTGVTITVLQYTIVAANTVTATWKSGSTALTGAMSMAVAQPISATSPPGGPLMKTAPGEALNLVLSGTVQVSGHMLIDKSS